MISPELSIGPFALHLYGLLIGFAILIGWSLAKKRASLYKISPKIFDSYYALLPITLAILFARIYHVVDFWELYRNDLASILLINNGGLGIFGAIAGGTLGVFIVTRIKKLSLLNLLDLTAPSFALGQAIGRVGNWINQEGFGPPSDLPWAIPIDEVNRPHEFKLNTHFHPTFFYEAALDLIIFFVLLFFAKKLKGKGQVLGLYMILYSVVRFFLEFLRIDTWTAGDIKVAQVISLVTFVIGIYFFLPRDKKDRLSLG